MGGTGHRHRYGIGLRSSGLERESNDLSTVSFDHVTLDYGRRRVLSDVSFDLSGGGFTGVLGPNGAGKSTIMRAILGLLLPGTGTVSVLGRRPRRGDPNIGYMPQHRGIDTDVGLSVREFLVASAAGMDWGRPSASRARLDEVDSALESVGAQVLAARPLFALSGGERQRIFVAQALMGKPRLLLLDEPLIGLDPGHQKAIVELVSRISRERNITVLFSAHEINPILPVVDKVLYLGSGRVAVGTVDEVINNRVLSELYATPVHVMHMNGRIFVLADECELESHPHHAHASDESSLIQ